MPAPAFSLPVAPVTRTFWITNRLDSPSPPAVTETVGVLDTADAMIVLEAASLPLPAPMIVNCLLTVTFSVYVPAPTRIVAPLAALVTALVIVL